MLRNRSSLFIIGALMLASIIRTDALAQNRQAPTQSRPVQIDRAGLLILIRQTLAALDFSNKSGNYTILREVSGPGFAANNDAARLSRLFQNQRERNIDYSGALVFEPQITEGPEITKNGILRFVGFFPSPTSQIKFEMHFQPVNGQWKLFGLAADIAPPALAVPIPQINRPASKPATSISSIH